MNEFWEDNSEWIWIALAVLAALILLGILAALAKKKKRERNRTQATEIRQEAEQHRTKLDVKDAETRRIEAEAQHAQAEADRLDAIAADKRMGLEKDREHHVERIREADKLDPDRRQRDDTDPRH